MNNKQIKLVLYAYEKRSKSINDFLFEEGLEGCFNLSPSDIDSANDVLLLMYTFEHNLVMQCKK